MKNYKDILSMFAFAGLFAFPSVALAYIGPGLGSGVFAAVIGIVVGLLMLVFGLLWYPIKRLYLRFKSRK